MLNHQVICCREVLGRLLQQYAPMVRSICEHRLGCHQCDDLQQEAFLRVIKSCHRVRDARHFPAYLGTITRNLCSDHIRARRSRPSLRPVDDELLENLPEPVDEAREDGTRELREQVERLPASLRSVLELFYFGQLDYAAIAERTGLSIGAVAQRLNRARRRLRLALTSKRRAG